MYIEDILTDIFFSLPFPAGMANAPKNVIKNDDFYRAGNGDGRGRGHRYTVLCRRGLKVPCPADRLLLLSLKRSDMNNHGGI
jgi:hypothetical protein